MYTYIYEYIDRPWDLQCLRGKTHNDKSFLVLSMKNIFQVIYFDNILAACYKQ